MKTCPVCGFENPETLKFCGECGESFNATGQLKPDTVLDGRYVVTRTLGRGGMGAVYQALNRRLNNTPVAIKEMGTRATGGNLQAAIAMFQKEAAMLIDLRHPALPRIWDFFSDGEQRWYLVMDYIEGKTLAQILNERGPIPETEVLDWAIQLCDILNYLHNHKPPIIFRDLKPSNIMLTPDGSIKLIDFGIARHFKQGATSDTTAYGSDGFAPPEQSGSAQTDPRADIYALGATLHYLLTGIDPKTHLLDFAPASQAVTVSPEFEMAIMKAVELKAANRPNSMTEMSSLLRKLQPKQDSCLEKAQLESGFKTADTAITDKNLSSSSNMNEVGAEVHTIPIKINNQQDAEMSKTRPIEDTSPNPEYIARQENQETGENQRKHKRLKAGNALMVALAVILLVIGGVYGFGRYSTRNSDAALNNKNKTTIEAEKSKTEQNPQASVNQPTNEKDITAKNGGDLNQPAVSSTKIVFNDRYLEKAIRYKINKPKGYIYASDLQNITELSLYNNKNIKNIDALGYMTNLKTLNLQFNQIADISPLKKLNKLQVIQLSNNQINDLKPLAGLSKLKQIDMADNKIQSINALRGLTGLEVLNVDNNQIRDMNTLRYLSNLKYVSMSNNQISDISALSGLTNLANIRLRGNLIRDISKLKGLTNLDFLELSNNQIQDVSILKGLTNLQCLYLDNNAINDISALAGLVKLQQLYLGGNPINDYSPTESYYNNLMYPDFKL